MHPWTKAYRDLYSNDDLETLFLIEKQMKTKVLENAKQQDLDNEIIDNDSHESI